MKARGDERTGFRGRALALIACACIGAAFSATALAQPYNEPEPPTGGITPSPVQSTQAPSTPSPSTPSPSTPSPEASESPREEVKGLPPLGQDPSDGEQQLDRVAPSRATLPFTGGDATLFVLIGALAISLGVVLMRRARHRRAL